MSVSRIPAVGESGEKSSCMLEEKRRDNEKYRNQRKKERKSLNEWQKIKSGDQVNEVLSRSRVK